jgi:eukaryotic-like serine/threonine-protein kinase
MTLSAGTKLGPYEIIAAIGAGGMGEVYRARDTRLGREVALKVLPEAFARDAERLARFRREAQVLASLNHPNIAAIYGFEDSGSTHALVMELVEGPTLAEKIKTGVIPFDEALPMAKQICEALEYAHERGVVHRDLKPANIKITSNDAVKVLDFGLAKALEGDLTAMDISSSPTITRMATQAGIILGTAAYMSPEQAKGKPVDRRTDIWAFGCVLYEMLTGKMAFSGETVTDTLAAILKSDPDWSQLPSGTPAHVRVLLRRCLQKDPRQRLQSIGDARITLEEILSGAAGDASSSIASAAVQTSARMWRRLLPWALAVALAFFAGAYFLRAPRTPSTQWKLVLLTHDAGLSDFPALSPDGKLVAYSSDQGLNGGPDLYVREVAGGPPVRLTTDGSGNTMPDFSPDGSEIVFRSDRDGGGIYEIPALGGDARLLAQHGLNPKFSPDGSEIAYWTGDPQVSSEVPGNGDVWVAPLAGGPPMRVAASLTTARYPVWLPDGKHLLLTGYASSKTYEHSSLDWWFVATDGRKEVRTGAYRAFVEAGLVSPPDMPNPGCWSATTDMIIFSAANADTNDLWEISISPQTGKVRGVPKRLTTGAGNEAQVSCGPAGDIVFANVETETDVWSLPLDLTRGMPRGPLGQITQGPADREYPSFSNDGRYVAFASDQTGLLNIWIRDLVKGKESSVAPSSLLERFPVMNASGTRVAYSVYEQGKRAVYVSSPGGRAEELCEGCLRATDWSRDEKSLLVFGGSPYQINILDLASRRQTPLLKSAQQSVLYGRFSPDNRWVSFTVRTAPNRANLMIAPTDGPKPVPERDWIPVAVVGPEDWANWSPDGKTLYFSSNTDGHECFWGQRLAIGSHRPVGAPFPVQHFHGRLSYQFGGWSAAAGQIGFVLAEETGNIWKMSRSNAQ